MSDGKADAKAIFLEALDCKGADEMMRFLQQACGADPALRSRVEELMRAHRDAGAFLGGVEKRDSASEHTLAEGPGTVVGPYKLLQQIGEGGMGTVFMAEQSQPIQRRVALKIIKAGMDTRQVIARFEAERQALALMDHVNIARVLDAGATAAGRPYFVMELVHGVPITKYCDENRLTPRERLALLVPVCQAVQHAHQKGIIHRDLKPSNVLVTLYDGRPVPKVIDFGVAKATEQKLTERTLFTQYGTLVGTLEYMSPEQAEMSALGVDTRSDVYSLGVLLYELLTGSTPLSQKRVREAAYADVLRMIKEEEPPRPSTRLSDSGEALASISAHRHMEPAQLTKLVKGELDWIVMKCLEKDRTRRYETVNGFAQDVERYLNDEAVQACPPSAGYRLRKFARRNKVALLTAGVVALALATGTVVSTGQAVRATLAEAETRIERDKAVAEKERADEEAAIAQAVNDFLQNDLLAAAAPEKNARNRKVTVEELLRRAAAGIAGKFEKQPRVEAAIRMTIGRTYHSLSDYPAAQPHLEGAWEIRRRVLGEEHPDTLASLDSLAKLYRAQGHYPKAEALFVQALATRRRVLGEEHPDTLASLNNLAGLYRAQGHYPEAEPLYVGALAVRRQVLGEEHPDTLASLNNLAGLYVSQGQHAKAEPFFVATLQARGRLQGQEHPETLSSMSNLAWLYYAQGQYAKAEPLWLTALDARRRVLGEEHIDTLTSLNNLAALYQAQEQYAKAEPLYVQALAVRGRVLGEEHPDTLASMNNLAALYRVQGQYAKAEPLYVQALERKRRVLGPEHPDTLSSMSNLAILYYSQDQYAKAEPLCLETLELKRRVLGEEHPSTLTSLSSLATLYRIQGRYPEAETLYDKTLAVRRRVLGEGHPDTLLSMNDLATTYQAQGQLAKGERIGREAPAWARKRPGGPSVAVADALATLGTNVLAQQKYADAEPLLRECLTIREPKQPNDWWTFHTKSMLGGSLLGQKKYADAEPLLVAGYEGLHTREARIPLSARPRLADALERLVQLYEATARKDQAGAWRKKFEARREAGTQAAKPEPK